MKTNKAFDDAIDNLVNRCVMLATQPHETVIPLSDIRAIALAYGTDNVSVYSIVKAELMLRTYPLEYAQWQQ